MEDLKTQDKLVIKVLKYLIKGLLNQARINKEYLAWLVSYFILLSPLMIFGWYWQTFSPEITIWVTLFSAYILLTVLFSYSLLRPDLKK